MQENIKETNILQIYNLFLLRIVLEQNTNIKGDESNIINIINDYTFNLHNNLLNNDNW